MKNFILLITVSTVLVSCNSNKKEPIIDSQEVSTLTSEKLYGESFDKTSVVPIEKLTELMASSDSIPMMMSGSIEKTCKNKGCWMQLSTDSDPIRVTFKDYGFFVPKTGMEGKQATVNGYCIRKETSVEELQHYAKDAGQTDEEIALITNSKTEYSFVASGVFIQ